MAPSVSFQRDAGTTQPQVRVGLVLRGVAVVTREFLHRMLGAVREVAARRKHWRGARWLPRLALAVRVAAVACVCLYVLFAAILYVGQRSLMYFPETVHTPPDRAGLAAAEEVALTTPDGERILAWNVAPRQGKPVILYFHGNGGALRYRAERFRNLIAGGVGLVAIDYRGFGGSSGSPTETGLIADAEAAYDFAAAHYGAQQLALWGESLGSSLAVVLAAEKPVARVILEAPFTSAAAVAAATYWYMPVRLLMKDQFRSDELIKKITAPVIILHGVHDNVVPYAMGERMFDLTTARKHIVRFLDGHHSDLDKHGALHAVGRFLAGDLD